MLNIWVTKHDGTRQLYSQEKLLRSILRSGIKNEEVLPLLTRIESKLYDGIPTKVIYESVHEEIAQSGFAQSSRFYRVREAMAKMGPVQFEQFVAKLLSHEGFSCQWNVIVPGFCIEHQIDVIAKNEQGENYYVEVKHHRNHHRLSGLGVVAQVWARLEDLQHGFTEKKNDLNFRGAWLICNTKFSEHSQKYAACKGVRLSGWHELKDSQSFLDREEMDQLLKTIV